MCGVSGWQGGAALELSQPALSEGALPPYPLRYPRSSRPTDIACVASSVPASGGRVETRHRLCCGTRLFGRFASNSLKQSSHSEDRRFIPIRAASGTAFLRKSSRTSPAAGNPLRSGSSAQLIHNNAFKVFREFRGRPGNRFRKQRVVIV